MNPILIIVIVLFVVAAVAAFLLLRQPGGVEINELRNNLSTDEGPETFYRPVSGPMGANTFGTADEPHVMSWDAETPPADAGGPGAEHARVMRWDDATPTDDAPAAGTQSTRPKKDAGSKADPPA